MKIFLTGIPGSGKSTTAKVFAGKYNFVFFDTDELIEKKYGKKISEIFEEEGEEKFREYEKDILEVLLLKDNIIVATGGGLPCSYDNMKKIKDNGYSVYLDVPLDILTERLLAENHRPLINGLNRRELYDKLKDTLLQRKKFYEQADLIIKNINKAEERAKLIFTNLQNFFGVF